GGGGGGGRCGLGGLRLRGRGSRGRRRDLRGLRLGGRSSGWSRDIVEGRRRQVGGVGQVYHGRAGCFGRRIEVRDTRRRQVRGLRHRDERFDRGLALRQSRPRLRQSQHQRDRGSGQNAVKTPALHGGIPQNPRGR